MEKNHIMRNRILYSVLLVAVYAAGAFFASNLLLGQFLGPVLQIVSTPAGIAVAVILAVAVALAHGWMLWLGVKRKLIQTWSVILLCLFDAIVVFFPTIVVGVFCIPKWLFNFKFEWILEQCILLAFLLLCVLRIVGTVFYFQNRAGACSRRHP